jgi:hypothetical protein
LGLSFPHIKRGRKQEENLSEKAERGKIKRHEK